MASAAARDYLSEDEEEERCTAGTEKEHSISAPGISDQTSAAEFKTQCRRVLNKFPCGETPASDSRNFMTNIARKMKITRNRVKELQSICK